MKKDRLERIISRIEDLPTLPSTVLKITELINNPKSSARDIARVVTDDQVLTARLLKLVNSSFYGFPQRISTVTGAIVLLGFDAIRNLLMTTSIFDLFLTRDNRAKMILQGLWDHSLGCAVGAKVIGNYLRLDKLEELFVSGLLHDIGKIIEVLFLPDEFSEIFSMVERENILLFEAEEHVLGFSHTDIGKLLAERWNLPAKLINVIACHHEPGLAGRFLVETAVVHLSDILCRAMAMGSGVGRKIPPLDKQAWEVLELDVSTIEPIMEEIDREFDDVGLFAT